MMSPGCTLGADHRDSRPVAASPPAERHGPRPPNFRGTSLANSEARSQAWTATLLPVARAPGREETTMALNYETTSPTRTVLHLPTLGAAPAFAGVLPVKVFGLPESAPNRSGAPVPVARQQFRFGQKAVIDIHRHDRVLPRRLAREVAGQGPGPSADIQDPFPRLNLQPCEDATNAPEVAAEVDAPCSCACTAPRRGPPRRMSVNRSPSGQDLVLGART